MTTTIEIEVEEVVAPSGPLMWSWRVGINGETISGGHGFDELDATRRAKKSLREWSIADEVDPVFPRWNPDGSRHH